MNKEVCEHKWVHRESTRKREEYSGSYCSTWIKVDYYFCEKCLEEREVKKTEDSREKPLWY